MRPHRGKIVPGTSLTGQQGINLIATIVGEMGYLWTPTTGHSDAGIDGTSRFGGPTRAKPPTSSCKFKARPLRGTPVCVFSPLSMRMSPLLEFLPRKGGVAAGEQRRTNFAKTTDSK